MSLNIQSPQHFLGFEDRSQVVNLAVQLLVAVSLLVHFFTAVLLEGVHERLPIFLQFLERASIALQHLLDGENDVLDLLLFALLVFQFSLELVEETVSGAELGITQLD